MQKTQETQENDDLFASHASTAQSLPANAQPQLLLALPMPGQLRDRGMASTLHIGTEKAGTYKSWNYT